jgi:plastocyanin
MKKLLILLTACVALALTFAACGDDNNDDNGGSSSAGTTSTEQTDTTAAQKPSGGGGQTVEVSMKDIAFNPGSITVNKGDTVTWTNDESIGHDVTKTDGPGPDFSSGDPGGLGEGDTFSETFKTAGEIKYQCTVHAPSMSGTITVK